MVCLVTIACSSDIKVSKSLNIDAEIFPDYKEVTIPVKIAPLNFTLLDDEGADTKLVIEGTQRRIIVDGKDFDIPLHEWRKLLEE